MKVKARNYIQIAAHFKTGAGAMKTRKKELPRKVKHRNRQEY